MNKPKVSLLTVRQAAERLGVSRSMVYALVANKALSCHRVGRCIRFSEGQMQEFLASCESERNASPAAIRHLDL